MRNWRNGESLHRQTWEISIFDFEFKLLWDRSLCTLCVSGILSRGRRQLRLVAIRGLQYLGSVGRVGKVGFMGRIHGQSEWRSTHLPVHQKDFVILKENLDIGEVSIRIEHWMAYLPVPTPRTGDCCEDKSHFNDAEIETDFAAVEVDS